MSLAAIPLADVVGATDLRDEYAAYQLIPYGELMTELSTTGVTLNEDPVESGIQHLNGLIAQIDAQKTRDSNIVHQAIKNESGLEVLFKKVQALYKREYDARLPHPPVAEFSNAQSREAACNSLLSELKDLLSAIEGSYSQAKTFTKMANNDLVKLDSTNKNISRQITVLQLAAEIGEIARPSQQGSYTFDPKG